jgi:tRNA (mo5U34)-methyltransferase
MATIEQESIQAKIAQVPLWRHRITLPGGITTPGSVNCPDKLQMLHLPDDLSGKRVLDIGCSDGFFSFECEKRGAVSVLAVDNYNSVYIDSPRGFHVAHEILQSRVEFRQADLFDLDSEDVGQFDLVLFLGVLYHLRHPLLALERLATLCRGQLVVETLIAPEPRGMVSRVWQRIAGRKKPAPWMAFYEHDEINRVPTTWWAPSVPCLEGMVRSCGFCGVKTVHTIAKRAVVHAFHPSQAPDAQELLRECGAEALAKACTQVLGHDVAVAEVPALLRQVSIPVFGKIKHQVAMARGKQFHQVERWQ